MTDLLLEQAWKLKQSLLNFVLEATGELAIALERYVATQLQKQVVPQDLIIDRFLVDGKVDTFSPIDLFIHEHPLLEEGDRTLLQSWHRTFTGLFAIEQVETDSDNEFEVRNWLTAKPYRVKLSTAQATPDLLKRLKPGEILLTRIAPLTGDTWMLATSYTLLGKLGKPKLAVAIGNFKENYAPFLYADAPELLEEAWRSVEQYHQTFLDFFGSDEITLPGYQLNQKMQEFQEVLTKQQLESAGIDPSKSLQELAADAGIEEDDLEAIAQEVGVETEVVSQLLTKPDAKPSTSKMVIPPIQLPDAIKKAPQVTVLAHARWGQMLLPNHATVKSSLEAEQWQAIPEAEKWMRQYLEDTTINRFVWQRLASQYPLPLERVLQTLLNRPDFQLTRDLEAALNAAGKPLEPELPQIASVPIHLHTLFMEAVQEVNKSKPRPKEKPKKTGFGFSLKGG